MLRATNARLNCPNIQLELRLWTGNSGKFFIISCDQVVSTYKFSGLLVPVLVRGEGILVDNRRTFDKDVVLNVERLVSKKYVFFNLAVVNQIKK